jgi:hypothetical protein
VAARAAADDRRRPPQAVNQIVGLRCLFPEDAFKRRDIAGLPNMMDLSVSGAFAPRALLCPRSPRARFCARARVCWCAHRNAALAEAQADYSDESRRVCEWVDRGAPRPSSLVSLSGRCEALRSAGGVPNPPRFGRLGRRCGALPAAGDPGCCGCHAAAALRAPRRCSALTARRIARRVCALQA